MKIGRYTAALLLLAVGGLLLTDQARGTHLLAAVWQWWPVLLIALGLEYLLFGIVFRAKEHRSRLDVGGLLFAVIVSAIVFGVTQGPAAAGQVLDKLNVPLGLFGDRDAGIRIDKGTTAIPVDPAAERIVIDDPNGSVTIVPGDVKQIEAHATVVVPESRRKDAERIAAASRLTHSGTDTIEIQAKGDPYQAFGTKTNTRMDLEITFPRDLRVNVEISSKAGNIQVDGLTLRESLRIESTVGSVALADVSGDVAVHSVNGSLKAERIAGNLAMEATNGSIRASGIEGNADIRTVNGSIDAGDLSGDAKISTTNGSIQAENLAANAEVHTTMGSVRIHNVAKGLQVDTTGGSIEAESDRIGGDWTIKGTVGNVTVRLPEDGDFHVVAHSSLNKIETDFPFQADKRDLDGKNGTGAYQVRLETNGSLGVWKAR